MKTIYRVLALGILMTAFTTVIVTPAFAQDGQAEKVALYKKYTDNYGGTVAQMEIAIEAGKQYIAKYGANPEDADQVNYLKTAVPALEESVKKIKDKAIVTGRYNRFDAAIKSKNNADTFSIGKDVIANEPADSTIALDAAIVLASIGYDQAVKKDDTYNNDAINYAKSVIQKLNAGQTSKNFGAYQYEYKTKDNALGWMNYTIGYITYYRQDKKSDSLPFLYKATQLNSDTKKFSDIYRIIGAWYLDEALRIDKERLVKITAAGNKDTDETLSMYALQRGYADRSIDAYARAFNIASAKDSKATKEYKDALYTQLQGLYKFRYDGDVKGIDAYVATVMNKPMPDPSTAVTPVAPEETTTTATTTPPAATTTPSPTKPSPTPPTKPATTPPTKPTSTTTTPKTDVNASSQATMTPPAKSKTPAKKATKKKRTR